MQNNILAKYFVNLNTKIENTVFLCGTSRSGTTWISNIINYKNIYRYIFEPFHPKYVSLFTNYYDRKYIPTNSLDNLIFQDMKKIISGQLRSPWSDQYNKKFISTKRLIKATRANLFISWLNNYFPQMPIILLLRHPCAVANSKLQLKLKYQTREWDTTLDRYLTQSNLLADLKFPLSLINQIEKAHHNYKQSGDIFENCIFAWCIENYVPLMQIKNKLVTKNPIYICFYEDFCLDLKQSAGRIFNFLEQTNDQKVLSLASKPSSQSQESSAILTNKNLLTNWQDNITQEQQYRAIEIVSSFGLDSLYNLNPIPNHAGLNKFLD